jgi:SAM-dependent methyltransferase
VIGSNNQDFRSIPAIWPDIEGRRVLDVGCGQGLYTRELARRGAVAVGVDFNVGALREAKRAGGHFHAVRADARYLPFRADAFEMVVSIEVLSHIDPQIRQGVLADIGRVLEAGGVAFVTLHNRWRLTFGQWLRLRRARRVYHTANLDVWPSVPEEGQLMVRDNGLDPASTLRYLNYHSRFTYNFFVTYPKLSKLVIVAEDLLSRIPILRRLAITFLLIANKPVNATDIAPSAEA